jgi:hypothetical protein
VREGHRDVLLELRLGEKPGSATGGGGMRPGRSDGPPVCEPDRLSREPVRGPGNLCQDIPFTIDST